jgi:hypothetical protein
MGGSSGDQLLYQLEPTILMQTFSDFPLILFVSQWKVLKEGLFHFLFQSWKSICLIFKQGSFIILFTNRGGMSWEAFLKNWSCALTQTLQVRALCRRRRRPFMAVPGTTLIKLELVNSSERLGDEFEKFIDIRNMQTQKWVCALTQKQLYPRWERFLVFCDHEMWLRIRMGFAVEFDGPSRFSKPWGHRSCAVIGVPACTAFSW